MATKIQPNQLADEIIKTLEDYANAGNKNVKQAVKRAADDCMSAIQSHITFTQRTGKYVRSFKLKTTKETETSLQKTWYASNGQHRLTHLLEKGHRVGRMGRTRAFPHIQYGEEIATNNLERYIREGF